MMVFLSQSGETEEGGEQRGGGEQERSRGREDFLSFSLLFSDASVRREGEDEEAGREREREEEERGKEEGGERKLFGGDDVFPLFHDSVSSPERSSHTNSRKATIWQANTGGDPADILVWLFVLGLLVALFGVICVVLRQFRRVSQERRRRRLELDQARARMVGLGRLQSVSNLRSNGQRRRISSSFLQPPNSSLLHFSSLGGGGGARSSLSPHPDLHGRDSSSSSLDERTPDPLDTQWTLPIFWRIQRSPGEAQVPPAFGEGERDETDLHLHSRHNASRSPGSASSDVYRQVSIHRGERDGARTVILPRGRNLENGRGEVVEGEELHGRAFQSVSSPPPPLLGIFRVLGLRGVSREEEEEEEGQAIGRGGREGAGPGHVRRGLLTTSTATVSTAQHRDAAGGASAMFRTPESIDAWCPAIPFTRLAASHESHNSLDSLESCSFSSPSSPSHVEPSAGIMGSKRLKDSCEETEREEGELASNRQPPPGGVYVQSNACTGVAGEGDDRGGEERARREDREDSGERAEEEGIARCTDGPSHVASRLRTRRGEERGSVDTVSEAEETATTAVPSPFSSPSSHHYPVSSSIVMDMEGRDIELGRDDPSSFAVASSSSSSSSSCSSDKNGSPGKASGLEGYREETAGDKNEKKESQKVVDRDSDQEGARGDGKKKKKVCFFSGPRSCAICIEDFQSTSLVRVLPCRHVFHRACIDSWFSRSNVCPLCLRDFQETASRSSKNPTQEEEREEEEARRRGERRRLHEDDHNGDVITASSSSSFHFPPLDFLAMPTRSSSPFSSSSSSRRPSHAPSAFAPPAVQESPSQGREEEEEIRIHLRRASGVGPPLSPPLFYSYVQRQHHQEAPRRFSLSPLHTQAPPVVERTRRRRREEEKGVDPIWSLGCLLPLPSIDRAIEGDEVSSSSFCGGGGAGERRGVERRVSEEREERRGRGASSLLGDREEA